MKTKRPLIIDTDPGIDDAIAILMLIENDSFDIKALTVAAGNKPLAHCVNNALGLIQLCNKDIKVAKGAPNPLQGEITDTDDVHGTTGLGSISLPYEKTVLYPKNAADTIIDEAIKAKGELEILAIAPLTNLAIAIMKYPLVIKLIKQITLMGGAISEGNVTPVAEFNICSDPEAAKIVFNSGIPISMIGLEATSGGFLTKDDLSDFPKSDSSAYKIALQIINEYANLCESLYNQNNYVLYDAVAAAILLEDTISSKDAYWVDVETKGELTRGMTVVDYKHIYKKDPNCNVYNYTDHNLFKNILINSLLNLK